MCSDEVMELMAGEFPRKYDEYMDVVQEREFQAALKRKIQETKRVAQMHVGGRVDDWRDSDLGSYGLGFLIASFPGLRPSFCHLHYKKSGAWERG